MPIDATTSPIELAAIVSQELEAHGIAATLSGGGAVSVYTDNEYESADLDFVTSERTPRLAEVLLPLGFELAADRRHFRHPETALYLEFPPGPLAFGNLVVEDDVVPVLQTAWGPLRVVSPTQCVMDRLAAYWHWNDRQSWDQAVMVARAQTVDQDTLLTYADQEGAARSDIDRLLEQAGSPAD